jgi:hypothetical protein
MYKSIADIFNSPDAIFNDPFEEIHNPVQSCDAPPEIEEYEEFLNTLDYEAYPKPKNKIVHGIINPLHGVLKPVLIK